MAEPRYLDVPAAAFNACYRPFVSAGQRTQIFYGGAGSGKVGLPGHPHGAGQPDRPQHAGGAPGGAHAAQQLLCRGPQGHRRLGLEAHFTANLSQMSLTCARNGAQMLFMGLDDVEKIKSVTPLRGALSDVWVEEATQCERADIRQLEKRLRGQSRHKKRLTLSFNPTSRGHWLYREYFDGFPEDRGLLQTEDLLILRTTYRDNAFLTPDDRQALENERDPWFYRVYTLGEWGVLGDSVLNNWRVGAPPEAPGTHTLRCGLDFGYARDPAAFVLASYEARDKRLYVMKEFLQAGLTNDLLAARVKQLAGSLPVICDSAEPKSIAELRRWGVCALPARKGPDSVLHGLQWLGQQDLVLSPDCPALRGELLGYRWTPDGQGGSLPRPQGEDHLIDALRYAMERDSQGQQARVISR